MLPPRAVKGTGHPVALAALLGLRSEETVRQGVTRWDVALPASLSTEVGQAGDARLVALEFDAAGVVSVELAAPFEIPDGLGLDLQVHLPGCSRAREGHARGNTAELERPIDLKGRVQALTQGNERDLIAARAPADHFREQAGARPPASPARGSGTSRASARGEGALTR